MFEARLFILINKKDKFVKNRVMAELLEQEMFTYFTQLSETEKKSIIHMLKTFVENREENAQSVTIEEYNREIEEAVTRVNEGHYIDFEDLKKVMQSW